MNDLMKWVVDNKEYAPLYSALVATAALLFSVFSFLVSNFVAKTRIRREQAISSARYEEQKKQYEDRLEEEKKQREQDRKDADERIRISEKPYLVFKGLNYVDTGKPNDVQISMEFTNKGMGTAYCIVPDVEIDSSLKEYGIQLYRRNPVEDPIAMVGEKFEMNCAYIGEKKENIIINLGITFKDSSDREYRQTYKIAIVDKNGSHNIMNFAIPELTANRE